MGCGTGGRLNDGESERDGLSESIILILSSGIMLKLSTGPDGGGMEILSPYWIGLFAESESSVSLSLSATGMSPGGGPGGAASDCHIPASLLIGFVSGSFGGGP